MKQFLVVVSSTYADGKVYEPDENGEIGEASEPFDAELVVGLFPAITKEDAIKQAAKKERYASVMLDAYELAYNVPQPKQEAVMSFDKFVALGNVISPRETIRNQTDYLLTMKQAAELMHSGDVFAYSLVDEDGIWMVKRFLIPDSIGYILTKRLVDLGDGVIYW